MNKNLTIEQRIVYHLAKHGFLTCAGDVQRALAESEYADYLVRGLLDDDCNIPDLDDNGTPLECDHDALTNDEIQEVFDNDIEQ